MTGWTRALRGAIGTAIVVAALFAAPLAVAAHVNGTVGPYTFLVVLVEEPYYATNHAGFEFWVRRAGQPVEGLERTLKAQAISPTKRIDLEVSPRNSRGFYAVDRVPGGNAFDPGGGGDWTLRLFGTVENFPVDKSFDVSFPSYPRVAAARPVQSASAESADERMPVLPLAAGLAGLLGAGVLVLLLNGARRGRTRRPRLESDEGR